MSARGRLWLQIVLGTAVAGTALFLISPPAPASKLPVLAAVSAGAAAGLCLYIAVTRMRPFLPRGTGRYSVVAAKYMLIGLLAADEEVVWRRLVLGECLRAGVAAALAGSALAFGLAHRTRPGLHLGTGAAFGSVYVATGALAASIATHWAYNALLATLADRARLRSRRSA